MADTMGDINAQSANDSVMHSYDPLQTLGSGVEQGVCEGLGLGAMKAAILLIARPCSPIQMTRIHAAVFAVAARMCCFVSIGRTWVVHHFAHQHVRPHKLSHIADAAIAVLIAE